MPPPLTFESGERTINHSEGSAPPFTASGTEESPPVQERFYAMPMGHQSLDSM